MARTFRIQCPHATYHFVRTLAEMVAHDHVILHAWVLMDDHYHLVLETPHANLNNS
jgi:REP element-mobilizing transposase RayT